MTTCNTLLDNSCDSLRMVAALRDLATHPSCLHLKIATGYWDIPGTALVLRELHLLVYRLYGLGYDEVLRWTPPRPSRAGSMSAARESFVRVKVFGNQEKSRSFAGKT